MKEAMITLISIVLTFAVMAYIVLQFVGPAFDKLSGTTDTAKCGSIHKVNTNCVPYYKIPLASDKETQRFA